MRNILRILVPLRFSFGAQSEAFREYSCQRADEMDDRYVLKLQRFERCITSQPADWLRWAERIVILGAVLPDEAQSAGLC